MNRKEQTAKLEALDTVCKSQSDSLGRHKDTMEHLVLSISELRDRADAIDAKMLPESMREMVTRALDEICERDKPGTQSDRSGRVELDHETEGTM